MTDGTLNCSRCGYPILKGDSTEKDWNGRGVAHYNCFHRGRGVLAPSPSEDVPQPRDPSRAPSVGLPSVAEKR